MVVTKRISVFTVLLSLYFTWAAAVHAAAIPEDRADIMYHGYSGGGINIQGPSLLIRKGFKDKVSASFNFYQDYISGASIDVLVSGSTYTEERTELSFGVDYLVDSTLLTIHGGNSSESDYNADSVSIGLSQEFFGDMTTLSMGYAHGEDTVMMNVELAPGEEAFKRYSNHKRFSLGLTQVLTKNWIMALNIESVIDAGFLNNPYRNYHHLDPNASESVRLDKKEVYPLTHNSDAIAIRSMYYLPYRASLRLEARVFTDSWGVQSQNFEFRYIHPIRNNITLEVKARSYSQTQADFYSDLFNYEAEYEFLARDKELSTYTTTNFGLGVTYDFDNLIPFTDKESVSFFWDFMAFDYDNFLDACASKQCKGRSEPSYAVGEEPTYAFQANIIRAFFSVYY